MDAYLHRLVEDLAHLIQPVTPAPQFRHQLKRELLAAHRQGAAQPITKGAQTFRAVVSWSMLATLPVLLGIGALLWRRSQRPVNTARLI